MVGEGISGGGMEGGGGQVPPGGNDRVTAWFLVRASDAPKVAEDLWKHVGNGYVIVRADVVSGATPKNIVVPVDATSESSLSTAEGDIKRISGDNAPTIARVEEPHPPDRDDGRKRPADGIEGNNAWG